MLRDGLGFCIFKHASLNSRPYFEVSGGGVGGWGWITAGNCFSPEGKTLEPNSEFSSPNNT